MFFSGIIIVTMRLDIITGKTYEAAYLGILRRIEQREVDLDIRHILIVPDRFTFFAEQSLTEKSGGIMDVEVMTLNRLYGRICPQSKYLGKTAGTLLIRKIISENRDKLTCYKYASAGLSQTVFETIMQFKASRIAPHTLANITGKLRFKLSDLSLIYTEYTRYLTEHFMIDSADKLAELSMHAEKFAGAHVYFALFDSFTAQGTAFIEELFKYAASVTVAALKGENLSLFVNSVYDSVTDAAERAGIELFEEECADSRIYVNHMLDNIFRFPSVKSETAPPFVLYTAEDNRAELEIAARTITKAVRGGMRYKDVGVLTGDVNVYLLSEIFDKYGIPHYVDKPAELSAHPLTRYLLSALSIVNSNFSRAEVFDFVFNPYFLISEEMREKFYNYCIKFAIDHTRFMSAFTLGNPVFDQTDTEEKKRRNEYARDMFVCAEEVRQKIAAAVSYFYPDIKNINEHAREFVDSTPDIYGKDSEAEKEILARRKLVEIISECANIFGEALKSREFAELIENGALSTSINIIPPHTDEVYIGTEDKFRGKRFKVMFVTGATAGALPLEKKDVGLITDSDIEELQRFKHKLEPMISAINSRSRLELLQALTAADSVYISYPEKREPSVIISALKKIFPAVKSYDGAVMYESMYDTEELRLRYYSYAFPTMAIVRSELSEHVRKYYENNILPSDEARALFAVYPDADDLIKPETAYTVSCGENLFLKVRSESPVTKVSQLECYFACPFKHFVQYGLRLKEAEVGGFLATDIGTLLHGVVETYVKLDYPEDIEACVDAAIERQLIDKPSLTASELHAHVLKRLRAEAVSMCGVLNEQRRYSRFETVYTELEFGKRGTPPIVLNAKGRDIGLGGVIDRVDEYNGFVRIVDYKSGRNVGLEADDIYYGSKIQLIVYLKALLDAGKRPAGIFYFRLNNEFSKEENKYKLVGFALNDTDVLCAMDTKLEKGSGSDIISVAFQIEHGTYKLSNRGTSKKYLLTQQDFLNICSHTEKTITKALEQIIDGYIEPAPNGKTVCSYCGMRKVCFFDTENGKVRENNGKVTLASFGGTDYPDGED